MSTAQTPEEQELAELIVSALNLDDLEAAEIEPEAQLFGGEYGLDSIDALELDLGVPATDPLTRPLDELVDMVLDAFPTLVAAAATSGR